MPTRDKAPDLRASLAVARVLVAVGAMIAVLATLVLLLLSPRGTEWQAIDAVKPLALAASVTVACLLTAGAPTTCYVDERPGRRSGLRPCCVSSAWSSSSP